MGDPRLWSACGRGAPNPEVRPGLRRAAFPTCAGPSRRACKTGLRLESGCESEALATRTMALHFSGRGARSRTWKPALPQLPQSAGRGIPLRVRLSARRARGGLGHARGSFGASEVDSRVEGYPSWVRYPPCSGAPRLTHTPGASGGTHGVVFLGEKGGCPNHGPQGHAGEGCLSHGPHASPRGQAMAARTPRPPGVHATRISRHTPDVARPGTSAGRWLATDRAQTGTARSCGQRKRPGVHVLESRFTEARGGPGGPPKDARCAAVPQHRLGRGDRGHALVHTAWDTAALCEVRGRSRPVTARPLAGPARPAHRPVRPTGRTVRANLGQWDPRTLR